MIPLVHALLHDRRAERPAWALAALSAASSAGFGAAVGAYAGRWQVAWAALKMPAFFFGTLAFSFAAMHLFAARDLRARQTFAAALEAVAVTAVVLGALAPIVALFSLSCPKPSPRAYRFLVLLLTASVAAAGIAGVARLHARLRSLRLAAAWTVIYQFVGAQMGWLLKPWVSCTYADDRFLPLRDNLRGNFYESVFRTLREFFS
jgi:hypothetical protein